MASTWCGWASSYGGRRRWGVHGHHGWHGVALRLFRQGFLSAASNPKGILFFAAFLLQFINPSGDLWLQFLVMAGTFAATEIAYELTVAAAAHRVRRWLVSVGRKFNQACGAVFGALGIGRPCVIEPTSLLPRGAGCLRQIGL